MIRNLRDLGGLTGLDGRKLKKNILLRSAMLNNLDDADIAWLREINVTKIIDLRTQNEVERRPDIMVPGIEYINYYLQDENSKRGLTMKGIRALMISAKTEEERLALIPDMKSFYGQMATDPFCINRFSGMIKSIVNYDKGAILFHCTSGKDRTGMTAALLCSMLGVSREDIFDDYLRSLEHAEWESAIMRQEFIDEGASDAVADKLKEFFMIDRAFLENFFSEIEKMSGTVDNYIKDVYKISDQEVEEFRNRILE